MNAHQLRRRKKVLKHN